MNDLDHLRKSIKALSVQYENCKQIGNRPELTTLDREAISESVCRRFKMCYDDIWTCLQTYLGQELGLPDVPNEPKPVLRIAAQNDLLGKSVDPWLEYADSRVGTNGNNLNRVGHFIKDADALYRRMSGAKGK
jgi:hypothetical protein